MCNIRTITIGGQRAPWFAAIHSSCCQLSNHGKTLELEGIQKAHGSRKVAGAASRPAHRLATHASLTGGCCKLLPSSHRWKKTLGAWAGFAKALSAAAQ